MAEVSLAGKQPEFPEISRDELARRLGDPSLVIVDVLPRDSYEAAHIAGALSLPVAEVRERARDLIPNPQAELAVYCAKFT